MKPRKINATANTRSIVIDTNLLLLYLIGKWDVTAIFHRFHEFGLTDCSIIKLAQKGYPVLTADGRLYSYLAGTNLTVANFNHFIFYPNFY